jgi:RNA polymerase sigma factor (sigma-70 family)
MTLSPKGREQLVAVPSIGRASEVTPRRAAPEADATRDLYERYARQIYSYCLHQLGNREEAEDATQSTFLNAFRGFKRGVDPEFESAWLYKIAHNVCLTRQRSSSRRRRVESPGDLDAMQDYVPAHQTDSDELIRLPEALDAMPEQQRRALLLREWQGLSYKEIGEELDLSQAAVETLLFRARRSLAAGLSEEPVKKAAGIAKRLGGGDFGSTLAIVKSLVLTGGVKVATAVATVAATSVVAATPVTRHAVEDVVAPRHHTTPVHQVSANAATSGGAAAQVSAPFSLMPTSPATASAPRNAPGNAPLTVAAAKSWQQRLALRAHNATVAAGLTVGHVSSATEPSASISAPWVSTAAVEVPASTPAAEPTPATQQPAATQPAAPVADKPKADAGGSNKSDTATPAATAPKKDDANAGQGTNSGNNGSSGKGENRNSGGATPAQPAAVATGQGATKVTDGSGTSNNDDNDNNDNDSSDSNNNGNNKSSDKKRDSNVVVVPKSSNVSGDTSSATTTASTATSAPTATSASTTTTTPTTTTSTTTTSTTTTTAATPPPPPPAPAATVTPPKQCQDDNENQNNRPAEGRKGENRGDNSGNRDGNGKRK